jgi:hypothetical protein
MRKLFGILAASALLFAGSTATAAPVGPGTATMTLTITNVGSLTITGAGSISVTGPTISRGVAVSTVTRSLPDPPLAGQHLDLAVFASADALGVDAVFLLEREVNDAPLGGGHRLEGDDITGCADLGSDLLCHVDQRFFATSAVALDVDAEDLLAAALA